MQIFNLDVYFRGRGIPTRVVVIAESFEQALMEIHELVMYRRSIEKIIFVSSVFINRQTTVYKMDTHNEDMFKFNIPPFSDYELEQER